MSVDPNALRADALDALGPHADRRARSALERCSLAVESEAGWTSSSGAMDGQRVILRADARTVGELGGSPSAYDAVLRGLALAFTKLPHTSLRELAVRWDGTVAQESSAAYRGSTPRALDLAETGTLPLALAAWARGQGLDDETSASLGALDWNGETLSAPVALRDVLTRALTQLFGHPPRCERSWSTVVMTPAAEAPDG